MKWLIAARQVVDKDTLGYDTYLWVETDEEGKVISIKEAK